MRKKLAAVMACALILGLSAMGINSQNKTYAKEAEMQLEVPDSIKKENEFTVKVILNSDVNLYSVDAYLSYSTDVLEYVPDNECVTGTDGVLELKDIYGEETKKAEYELTFKALDTGAAEISFTDIYLIDYEDLDYITVTPSAKKFDVGINRAVEEDARLSDLLVAPGELMETFDPNQLEYEMHVGMDVESIGISAVPMREDSVVGLEMPEHLQEGENLVTITVTALSGNVNIYTIKVIRKDWPEEALVDETGETEETTEKSPDETVPPDVIEDTGKEEPVVTTEQENNTEISSSEETVTEEITETQSVEPEITTEAETD